MTNNKNDGKLQCSDVQNRFTAYLLLAVKRRKQEYTYHFNDSVTFADKKR